MVTMSWRRKSWTPEEDRILKDYVTKHGPKNWAEVPKNSGLKRTGQSCCARWARYLRPDLTEKEERQIVELHASLGNQCSKMADKMPGRSKYDIHKFLSRRKREHESDGLLNPLIQSPPTQLGAVPPALSKMQPDVWEMMDSDPFIKQVHSFNAGGCAANRGGESPSPQQVSVIGSSSGQRQHGDHVVSQSQAQNLDVAESRLFKFPKLNHIMNAQIDRNASSFSSGNASISIQPSPPIPSFDDINVHTSILQSPPPPPADLHHPSQINNNETNTSHVNDEDIDYLTVEYVEKFLKGYN